MSWTNRKLEKQADKLFEKGIRYLAESRGELFRWQPDAGLESYFVPRTHRKMEPSDFLLASCSAEGDLSEALNTQWARESRLLPLTKDMAQLARSLRKEGQEQTDEVSPFIYVMF